MPGSHPRCRANHHSTQGYKIRQEASEQYAKRPAQKFLSLRSDRAEPQCKATMELIRDTFRLLLRRLHVANPIPLLTCGSIDGSVLAGAFSSGPQNYTGQAFAAMAGLRLAAGLTPKLQFGEILWWFLANVSAMAFQDADTQAAAQTALGRALVTFHTPNDDPSVNSYADPNFLRTRLYNYVAAMAAGVRERQPSRNPYYQALGL